MANGTNISVTWHAPSGQFRKQVGKQIGRKGEPSPKVHYLGSDEMQAKRRALSLVAEWNGLRDEGHAVWHEMKAGVTRSGDGPQVVQVNASDLTVGNAIELYREDVRRRCELGLGSASCRNTTGFRPDWLCRAMSGRLLLSDVEPQEIKRAVEFFASRTRRAAQRLRPGAVLCLRCDAPPMETP